MVHNIQPDVIQRRFRHQSRSNSRIFKLELVWVGNGNDGALQFLGACCCAGSKTRNKQKNARKQLSACAPNSARVHEARAIHDVQKVRH